MFTFGGSLKRHRTHPQPLERLQSRPWGRQSEEEGEEGTAGFQESMVEGLPDPARRWLLHAINPGTPPATRAHLIFSGEIRPESRGEWFSLQAEETLAPPFRLEWEATARRGFRVLRTEERYAVGQAQMRSAWFGLLPFSRASGPDFSRSTLGRLMLESVWIPSCLLPHRGVTWKALDESRARAEITVQQTRLAMTLVVGPDGRLQEVSMERHGSLRRGLWETLPYGFRVVDECPFSGYTIPAVINAGWMFGTDEYQESARYRIDQAEFYQV